MQRFIDLLHSFVKCAMLGAVNPAESTATASTSSPPDPEAATTVVAPADADRPWWRDAVV